jgi:long chain fatty acid CoA FadD26
VGSGYWGKPGRSNATFAATLRGEHSGLPAGPWLRTGDLGVHHEGELYVTGRLKDLIIVDGRNDYPQDVEETVAGVHEAIRRGRVVAFAVPGADTENAVVVAEHELLDGIGWDDLVRLARKTVSDRHGLALADVVFVPPGAVPRTTSGKLARGACRAAYLRGELVGVPQ